MTDQVSPPQAPFHPDRLLADRLVDLLDMGARDFADRPAYSVVLPNGSWGSLSYGETKELSDAIAFYLREELGLAPGTAVAVQAPNCLAYPLIAKGVWKAGLVFTGVNPLYTPHETQHQLADSGAKVLFMIDLFGDRLDQALAGTEVETVILASLADGMPPARRAVVKGALKLKGKVPKVRRPVLDLMSVIRRGKQLQAGRDVAMLSEGRSLDDTVVYQYTSGTTGRAKGAEILARNILSNVTQMYALNGDLYRPGEEVGLVVLPLYHVYALTFACLQSPRAGNHSVLVPLPRPLSNLKPVFKRFDITVLPGINTLFQGLLNEDWFVDNPPPSLCFCMSGAAPLQAVTRERWHKLTGCRIFEGYGLTESTCAVTLPNFDQDQPPGTVGKPIPGTELKLVDETGQEVPQGQPGEIVVRGPQVVKGYLKRPDATAEAIKDGWLHTGDIGVFDEGGHLRIVDRKKDMIIVSGFNVYPAEVEDALVHIPGVAEAAVVGAPCDKTGEQVVAYIVRSDPALNEQAVHAQVKDRLTNYKRPRQVAFIDALPKSPVGKVLRRELREDAVKRCAELQTGEPEVA